VLRKRASALTYLPTQFTRQSPRGARGFFFSVCVSTVGLCPLSRDFGVRGAGAFRICCGKLARLRARVGLALFSSNTYMSLSNAATAALLNLAMGKMID